MRRLIVFLIGLLIMVGGFVASMLMLGDEERLKRLLAAHVESHLGRQLEIEGSVSLRLFPRLEIQAGDVRLSGTDAFEAVDLLSSDRLTARIRFAPLLRGQVETQDLSIEGANLNLLFDENGGHSLSGLIHHQGRDQSPGILVNGPLRLENLSVQIGRLGSQELQELSVDRVELDGLGFDRALNLVFEGAIGVPAVVEDVFVSGVLYVPAASGQFRLSKMRMSGKARGALSGFNLSGDLDVSAQPPLAMSLRNGVLTVDDERAGIEGEYRAAQRPFFAIRLSGQDLNVGRMS